MISNDAFKNKMTDFGSYPQNNDKTGGTKKHIQRVSHTGFFIILHHYFVIMKETRPYFPR